jgi:hypothetical protein
MTDYEMFLGLLKKLPQENGQKIDFVYHDEALLGAKPVNTVPNAQFINIRINGLVFDEKGALVGSWAEYD